MFGKLMVYRVSKDEICPCIGIRVKEKTDEGRASLVHVTLFREGHIPHPVDARILTTDDGVTVGILPDKKPAAPATK